MQRAVLLWQSPDQPGIIARLSGLLFEHSGNILSSDQYTTDAEHGRFFIRIEFVFDEDRYTREHLETALAGAAQELEAEWGLYYAGRVLRMAIAVSRYDHCLADVLYRVRSGELRVDVPLAVSNHEDVRALVEGHGIPFYCLPVTAQTRSAQEARLLALLCDSSDFLVLARYMQVLSPDFLRAYGKDVINIHHSFLPSFKGADPYRQAYDRGVKIIGATAHFATTDLDEGPIIEQVVGAVTHKDTVDDLRQKGRDLEKAALANAIRAYVQHRVIRYRNKTIILG
jgi:formyltetrahydrofolate deformylase